MLQQTHHHNNIAHKLLLETMLSVLNPVSLLVLSSALVNNNVQCPHFDTWENWGFKRLRNCPIAYVWWVIEPRVWFQVLWTLSSCHSAIRILIQVQQLSFYHSASQPQCILKAVSRTRCTFISAPLSCLKVIFKTIYPILWNTSLSFISFPQF